MYCNLSNVNFMVNLDSGNKAVYSVAPHHVHVEGVDDSCRWPVMYGRQIAHEKDGVWYAPGGWEEILDQRMISLLERCPEA